MKQDELVALVAERTFLPEEAIRTIFYALLEAIIENTAQGKVSIRHYGHFRRVSRRSPLGGLRTRLAFTTAKPLKIRLEQEPPIMPMDKYGVEFSPQALEKMAADMKDKISKGEVTCGQCGAQLDSISPPHCPNCGTLPFEKFHDVSIGLKNEDE